MLDVITQLEDRIGRLITEVETLRDLRMALQDENSTLRNQQGDYNQLVASVAQKTQEIALFASERNELEYMRAELQNNTQLQEKFEYSQLRVEELEQWHSNVCTHRDEVQTLLDVETQKNQQLQQELAQLRLELQGQQSRLQEMEGNLQFANQEKDRFWSNNTQAHQEITNLRQALSATEGVRDALFLERDNLLLQVQNVQSELGNLYGNNQATTQHTATLEAELTELRQKLAEAQDRDERMKQRLGQLIERIQLAENALLQNGQAQPVQLEVFQ